MAKIKINVTQVMSSAGQGSTVQRSVSSVATDINNIKNKIDSRILDRNSIRSRLNNVKNEVSDIHSDIIAICAAVSTGAMNYNVTENNVVKNIQKIDTVSSKQLNYFTFNNISKYESMFRDNQEIKSKKSIFATWTVEQKKQFIKSIIEKKYVSALKILGITNIEQIEKEEIDLFNEIGKALKGYWEDITNIEGGIDLVEGAEWDTLTAMLESSNSITTQISSFVNTVTALHQGPSIANSFVILDPNVASKTSTFMSWGNKVSDAMNSTAGKIGIPLIGGIIDYGIMRHKGETTKDAAIKATVHVGIGLAGGKAGAALGGAIGSIIPGAGTAVGAVVGFVAGVAITTVGNTVFDTIYDNKDKIKESVSALLDDAEEGINNFMDSASDKLTELKHNVSEWKNEKKEQLDNFVDSSINAVKESKIGKALSWGWNSLGTVFA